MIQANSHGATFTDDFDEVLEASAASIPGAPAAARAWMVANKTASRRFISARHAVAELRQLQAEAVPLQVLLAAEHLYRERLNLAAAAARSAQHAAATLGRLIVPKP
jgi:hypothetical protein